MSVVSKVVIISRFQREGRGSIPRQRTFLGPGRPLGSRRGEAGDGLEAGGGLKARRARPGAEARRWAEAGGGLEARREMGGRWAQGEASPPGSRGEAVG